MFFVTLILISSSSELKGSNRKVPNEKKRIKDGSCYDKPTSNVIDISDYTDSFIDNEYTVYGCNGETSKCFTTTNCRFLLYNSIFNSVTGQNGGAIYLMTYGDSEFIKQANIITKCQFIKCQSPNGGSGGAIYALLMDLSCEFQITDTLFENCQGRQGGAIYYLCLKGTIENCRFVNNIATSDGCDIFYTAYNEPKDDTDRFSIINCQFEVSTGEGSCKSMITMSANVNDKYNFHFKNNKITITNSNANFHLFDSTEDVFNGVLEFSGNCISPSDDKSIIKGPTATKLVIDTEKDFVTCKSEPPAPFVPPNQEILNQEKCNANERCDYQPQQVKEAVYLYVDLSDFNGITKADVDGAAIHLVNCGFNCNKTSFEKCSAKNGGGGAIYAKNTLDLANSMTFDNLKFKQCSASYGGGIYVYSNSEQNFVTIGSCTFDSNSIIESANSPLIGGAAMYVTVKNGRISGCTITGNSNHGAVKLTSDFSENSYLRRLDQLSSQNLLLVSNSVFNQGDEATTSIYYVSGSNNVQVEVNGCTFKGKLADKNRFIDGKLLTKEASRISVNSCTFDCPFKYAVNAEIVKQNESKKVTSFLEFVSNNLYAIAFCVVAVSAAVAFLILRKKKSDDDEKSNE